MGITGVGGIPGAALVFVGIDQIIQGSLNMRYGRVGKNLSVIEDFVFRNTGSEVLAVLTPGALSLGLGWYGSLARAAAREAAGMAMPAFRLEDGLYRGALMGTAVADLTAAEVAAARATESWWTLLRLRLGDARLPAFLRSLGDVRVPAFAGSGAGGVFAAADVPVAYLHRLARISAATGRESGLLLLENGKFVIRLGEVGFISPRNAKWFFAHTHPNGNLTLSFRGEQAACDVAAFSKLQQPWAIIVGQRGHAILWTSSNKNYWGDGVGLAWEALRGMR